MMSNKTLQYDNAISISESAATTRAYALNPTEYQLGGSIGSEFNQIVDKPVYVDEQEDDGIDFELTYNYTDSFNLPLDIVVGPTENGIGIMSDVHDYVIEKLTNTGCYMPEITKVVYNKSTKNGVNKLTTIVHFADETKAIVSNSLADKVDIDENGKITKQAKEIGLVYAIAKRILAAKYKHNYSDETLLDQIGCVTEDIIELNEKANKETCLDFAEEEIEDIMANTEIQYAGFGNKLSRLVKNSYDCQEMAKKKAEDKERRRKAHEEKLKADKKRKEENPSLNKVVQTLSSTVMGLQKIVETMQANNTGCISYPTEGCTTYTPSTGENDTCAEDDGQQSFTFYQDDTIQINVSE
jgi:hypothetical protein